jgi:hypothetical protein
MGLVNMKMSKEEAKEQCSPSSSDDQPRYPYGLSINLDDDAMGKLGIGDGVNVGDEVTITAKATVTSKSGYQTMVGDAESSIGLQITDMEVSGRGDKKTKTLYDKK